MGRQQDRELTILGRLTGAVLLLCLTALMIGVTVKGLTALF